MRYPVRDAHRARLVASPSFWGTFNPSIFPVLSSQQAAEEDFAIDVGDLLG